MLSQDKVNADVVDTNELFETLMNLNEFHRILVAGFIHGLAAKESVSVKANEQFRKFEP